MSNRHTTYFQTATPAPQAASGPPLDCPSGAASSSNPNLICQVHLVDQRTVAAGSETSDRVTLVAGALSGILAGDAGRDIILMARSEASPSRGLEVARQVANAAVLIADATLERMAFQPPVEEG